MHIEYLIRVLRKVIESINLGDEYGRDNEGRAKIVKDIIEMCRENLGTAIV